MKTYQFKLYQHKRNKHLHRTINAASNIYNHCIALHKRYYRLFGKHLNKNKLMKHIAKLRNKNEYWQLVGSQGVQDIVQRIDRAYQLFFKHHQKGVRPPNFRKKIKYKSFTLKQAGYKFLDGNRLRIGKRIYKFWKSREIKGKIKTITIKRNPLGELFVFVVTDYVDAKTVTATGKTAGFDFGCKIFLTCSEGFEIKSPLFLKQSLKELKLASRNHSRKKKARNALDASTRMLRRERRGSKGREKARKHLVRVHEKVANRRRDWFWKLAHELTDKFDYLFFETLNLNGMKGLWGGKISDLALAEFLKIIDFVAAKKGKTVSYIDRWYPSSKECSECHQVVDELPLNIRYWICPNPACNARHGRDSNASKNIKRAGSLSLGLDGVRQSQTATVA